MSTYKQYLTKKNAAIAGLCSIGLASLYATYKIRQFLHHIPFASSDDALSLTKNVDFKNKVILITGCTSGIGQATLIALLQTNAKIIMAVRNTAKAEKVKKEIDPTNKYATNIDIMELNLSSIKQIDEFVGKFKSKYNKLDVLICNAGVSPQREGLKTVDGYELAFGVNHLGHMHLALSLKTELENADDYGRLIVLSGDIFKYPLFKYDVEKLNSHQLWPSYAHSKLLNVMFVNEFNERYPFDKNNNKSILCVSLHPGVGKTNLLNDRDNDGNIIAMPRGFRTVLFQTFGDSVQQLAYTSVYLATEDIDKLKPSAYYCVKEVWDTNDECKDKAKCAKLWEVSLKYIEDARKK